MTSTLLLRLAGPMQSWGTRSRFTERDTELEPSKSGVIGLICAALGRTRTEPVDDLAQLRMGVRVDFQGTLSRDFHTAGALQSVYRASSSISHDPVVSNRYYLADADFLVGMEHTDHQFLVSIEEALKNPVWQLSLGRKAFVPGVPIYLPGSGGIMANLDLKQALLQEPWPRIGLPVPFQKPDALRFVLESNSGPTNEVRQDQPRGASFQTRSFGPRFLETEFHGLQIESPEANIQYVPLRED